MVDDHVITAIRIAGMYPRGGLREAPLDVGLQFRERSALDILSVAGNRREFLALLAALSVEVLLVKILPQVDTETRRRGIAFSERITDLLGTMISLPTLVD